jgi:hypothetical protein
MYLVSGLDIRIFDTSEGISSLLSVLGCFPKFVFDANLFIYFKVARAHNYQESIDFNILSC